MRRTVNATVLLTFKGLTWLTSPYQYLVKRFQFGWAKFDEAAGVFGNNPAHGAGELPDGALPVKHATGHVSVPLHSVEGVLLQARYRPANREARLAVRRGQFVERHIGTSATGSNAFGNMRFTQFYRVFKREPRTILPELVNRRGAKVLCGKAALDRAAVLFQQ